MSARLPLARRSAWRVFRAPAHGRRHGADHLRPLVGFLHRPNREKTSQPVLSRFERTVLRHGGMQSRLQVLPELGHLQVARDGYADGSGVATRHRRSGAARGMPERRIYLQRPGDLRRVCNGHRGRLSGAGDQIGCRHRGLHGRGSATRLLRQDGCRECGPQRLHRRVLREAVRRALTAGARYAGLFAPCNRCLDRDHDPADPGQERLRRGNRSAVEVDDARARIRCAAAFHGVSP